MGSAAMAKRVARATLNVAAVSSDGVIAPVCHLA